MAGDIIDGVISTLGGVDAGSNLEELTMDKLADGRNISISGGRPSTRPDFMLTTDLPAGRLQGGGYYKAIDRLILQIAGRLYKVDTHKGTYEEISITADWNNANRPQVWTVETDTHFIIQDGQARPIIYDGYKARRTVGSDEVPVGQAMAWGNKRLSVVVGLGNRVRIGDIFQPDVVGSELKFTETTFLLGGGDFSFPGLVTAMFHLPVLDSATGVGSLIVCTDTSVHTLNTDITNRDIWPDMDSFQSLLFSDTGVTGSNSYAVVNQDVWFRSSDGLRSLRLSVQDQGTPGSTPVSTEMAHKLPFDSPRLLHGCSLAYFDNRLLISTTPLNYADTGAMFHGIVSLNYDALHSLGRSAPPAYEGTWDGLKVHQLFTDKVKKIKRCFFTSVRKVDELGVNALFEIVAETEDRYNIPGWETIVNSRKELTTRALTGITASGSARMVMKRLIRTDVSFSGIDGDVTATLYFRPDRFPYFMKWDEWSFSSQFDIDSSETEEFVWTPSDNGYRMKLSTKAAPNDIHWMNDRGLDVGFSFQTKLVWTGKADLDYIRVKMDPLDDLDPADNPVEDTNKRADPSDVSVPIYYPDEDMYPFYLIDPLNTGPFVLTTGDGETIFTTGDGDTQAGLGSN